MLCQLRAVLPAPADPIVPCISSAGIGQQGLGLHPQAFSCVRWPRLSHVGSFAALFCPLPWLVWSPHFPPLTAQPLEDFFHKLFSFHLVLTPSS